MAHRTPARPATRVCSRAHRAYCLQEMCSHLYVDPRAGWRGCMDHRPNVSRTGFLDGGGQMGALMRAYDWSRTSLGDPAEWPGVLKTAVATCLSSRFPMVIWWGPRLLMLYNDAWQPILGETKHPAGLGRPGAESWPETWPVVGAQFENALRGVASWSADLLLASDRRGFLEESYFTYS